MVKVIATTRGYFGGELRDPGTPSAIFDVPDDLWTDKKRRPSWAVPYEGKAEPADAPADADDAPAKGKGKGGRKKAEPADAPAAEPFADAPKPVRVANEVNDATGGTQPDWVAPQAVAD